MTAYNIKKENLKHLEKFFINNNKTFIWSCLQGYMGEAYGDNPIKIELKK